MGFFRLQWKVPDRRNDHTFHYSFSRCSVLFDFLDPDPLSLKMNSDQIRSDRLSDKVTVIQLSCFLLYRE